jgi:RsmE family RNA methyltransferase
MNLLILFDNDFIDEQRVRLTDRRLQHVITIHQSQRGDSVRVGLLNGSMGKGIIESLSAEEMILTITLDQAPPKPLPLTLIVALPRPKMLRRILRTSAELGIKTLYFINSYKVEKSYWQSPALKPQTVENYFIQGLEQSRDTMLPSLHLRKRFKPFIEDELPDIIKNTKALVAHPNLGDYCPQPLDQATTLMIGPEGGFIPYEIEKLLDIGFSGIHLGERILRVENAITVLTAKLFSA